MDDEWGGESLAATYDAARPRNAQTRIGPSGVDSCIRQLAYRHFGVPESDGRRSMAAARLGTLLHLGWAQAINALGVPGYETEVDIRVPESDTIGHADLVDRVGRIVSDLKTCSHREWERAVTFGPREKHWHQVEVYAFSLTWESADMRDDARWSLRLILLDRETGEEAEFSRPQDYDEGARLVAKLNGRQALLDRSSPDDLMGDAFPREGAGPGRGMPCDWCPWMSTCWAVGWAEPPLSPQSALIAHDPAQIAAAGEDYLAASEDESKAKKQKGDARARLEGLPAGDYGGVRLKWRGGGIADPKPDVEAMEDVLIANEIPVPYLDPREKTKTINVTRVPPKVEP